MKLRFAVCVGIVSVICRSSYPQAEGDLAFRRMLAEQILAAREGPGRTLDPLYRERRLESLLKLPVEQLQERGSRDLTVVPLALGDRTADLIYTSLPQPCRIIDTRGGPILSGERSFKVAGTGHVEQGGSAEGCGIPLGTATAALINFVAVNPTGPGNLRGSAWPNPVPLVGSLINYQLLAPALNVANGLVFPICNPDEADCGAGYDITVFPNGSSVHLVADVIGYFSRFTRDFENDLTYTTLAQPCRVFDTRSGAQRLGAGESRNFKVVGDDFDFPAQGGTDGGCGVPNGALAAMINFTAVNPSGIGNLKGSAFPNPIPLTGSVINYQALTPVLNIANGVVFPLCNPSLTCTADITLQVNGSAVDAVGDVLGYFTKISAAGSPPTQRDLTYTTFDKPCRIIDTRADGAGGPLNPGAPPRNFRVKGTGGFGTQGGTLGGCGVPSGATVAMINFTAVNAQGPGNLKGSSFPNAIPATGSVINYQALNPPINLANGLLFPLCDSAVDTCTADITLAPNGAGVDLVADVLGYAKRTIPILDPTAIYVSITDPDGSDDVMCGLGPATTGSMNYPCSTILQGLIRALNTGRNKLLVAEGEYTGSLDLQNVSLYGGYDAETWTRDASVNITAITGTTTTAVLINTESNVTVNGFVIQSPDATTPGTSSYGMRILNSAGIMISGNDIRAGAGAAGNTGVDRTSLPRATSGNPGVNGCDGCSDGGSGGLAAGSGTIRGGAGGGGGYDTGSGGTGQSGGGGATAGGGGSGSTVCFSPGDPGGIGSPGDDGTFGPNGGNAPFSPRIGFTYTNVGQASAGGNGTGGEGGGGGGGGGGGAATIICSADRGGGGGGGGVGGSGGQGGGAGSPGGASIAILVFNSTATVQNNILRSGNGGAGGRGGAGAAGQLGGLGANGGFGRDDSGDGGRGGDGGDGGEGGDGGGGSGGPSYGIYQYPAVSSTGNTYDLGVPGAGGTRGTSGPQAANGDVASVKTGIP